MKADPQTLGLITKALAFAAHKHRDQRRKGVDAHPYINHPIALADILVNEGGVTEIEVIAAALLHDTVEDTETSLEELESAFGPAIAGLVAEVTDDKSLPQAERKRRQVEHAAHLSRGARLIKLADKTANLRDVLAEPPPDWDEARRAAYFDWAREVIDALRGAHPGLEAVFDATCQRRSELF